MSLAWKSLQNSKPGHCYDFEREWWCEVSTWLMLDQVLVIRGEFIEAGHSLVFPGLCSWFWGTVVMWDKEEEKKPSVPVELNPPGASSQTSRMSFGYQGDGNRAGIALMGLLGKCSVINRQSWLVLSPWICWWKHPGLIPRICFLPEGLKSLDDSGCSFTGVRTWRNQGETRILESSWEEFD